MCRIIQQHHNQTLEHLCSPKSYLLILLWLFSRLHPKAATNLPSAPVVLPLQESCIRRIVQYVIVHA